MITVENIPAFNLHELSRTIADVVVQLPAVDKETIVPKIVSCLQRYFDLTKLVPQNYNKYIGKKKRDKWVRQLQIQDVELKFWKDILKRMNPNINIQQYYDELNTLLDQQGFRSATTSQIICFYCERKVDAGKFGGDMGVYITQDHIIPKSKFGKTHDGNLINACNECNFLKADRTIKQFITNLENMITNKTVYMNMPLELYPIILKNANKLL
jgi:5-methylcytosine-specific restriction endonuclease McrA